MSWRRPSWRSRCVDVLTPGGGVSRGSGFNAGVVDLTWFVCLYACLLGKAGQPLLGSFDRSAVIAFSPFSPGLIFWVSLFLQLLLDSPFLFCICHLPVIYHHDIPGSFYIQSCTLHCRHVFSSFVSTELNGFWIAAAQPQLGPFSLSSRIPLCVYHPPIIFVLCFGSSCHTVSHVQFFFWRTYLGWLSAVFITCFIWPIECLQYHVLYQEGREGMPAATTVSQLVVDGARTRTFSPKG